MRNELEKYLSELKGMQRILNRDANNLFGKNKAWVQAELVDDAIERTEGILNMKGVLDYE